MSQSIFSMTLAAVVALSPVAGLAQHHPGAGNVPSTLGSVHFAVSCTPEGQAAFDDAMKLQHSFWYQAADEAFQQVLQRDPNCVMALWGRALARLGNPFGGPTAANLTEGRAWIEQAQRTGARTEREAGMIAALGVIYTANDPAAYRAQLQHYELAMAQMHQRFPDDSEIAILYALALDMAASPTDKTYSRQNRAAEILEREFANQPMHPGAAHYLIHTYDSPALAAKGLAAAERYAKIAADAPHALHMPSHIFTRIGRWEESIEANRRSAATARAREVPFDEVHAMDYLVYGHLQLGQPEAARNVIAEVARLGSWSPPNPINAFGVAAMPARFALERGAWDEAASLPTKHFGFPFVDAITHFARSIGAARAGRPEAAEADVAALRAAAAALQGRDAYWGEQVDIQRAAAEGWVAFARGKHEDGLALLQEAAEREGRTDKHPVTPGPLAPAREQLAEMLLLLNRGSEAQREFEAVKLTEPRRFRAVFGAGRAAELAGNRDAARTHYTELLEIAANAENSSRPELAAARSYLTQ